MSARKMEARRASPEPSEAAGEAAWRRSLLPRKTARLLVLGELAGEIGGDGEGGADVVLRASSPAAVRVETFPDARPGEGPFDAVLWASPAAEVDAAALARVRDWLTRDGRLALVFEPLDDAGIRPHVQRLSEVGFAIVRQEDAPFGTALVARRDPFAIRAYRDDADGAAIRELFRRSFGAERRAEHWRWKYHDGPWGGGAISLAFSQEGRLACHYAGYPMPFRIAEDGGHDLLGLQMGDTMTDPDFRRVGRGSASLLARTVRHFFAIYRQGPFGFFYGFNTGPIQRFCDWFIGGSRVEKVGFRRREGSAPPAATGRYRVARVARLGREWDRFFARVAPSYRFLVRRDAEYLAWRYCGAPEGDFRFFAARRWGRLAGWAVFRRREDRLLWGDALFDPRHAGAAADLLAAALAEAPDVAGVEGWFPDRPAFWDAELTRLGFETRPEPNDLGIMYLPDSEPRAAELLARAYYTMGDGDLF